MDHVFDDDGGEALAGFVEQDEAGVAHQGAGDGEHLLFAAAHPSAGAVAHGGEVGEEGEQTLGCPGRAAVAGGEAADFEVFHHGKLGEDAAVLGDVAEAGAGDGVGFASGDVLAGEGDAPGGGADEADEGFEGGGFAGAVAAEQDEGAARGNMEAESLQDVGAAVMGVQGLEMQHQWPPVVAPEPR